MMIQNLRRFNFNTRYPAPPFFLIIIYNNLYFIPVYAFR